MRFNLLALFPVVELLAYKVEQEKRIASDLQRTLSEEQEKASAAQKLLAVERGSVSALRAELCECRADNERLLRSLNDVQKEVLQLRCGPAGPTRRPAARPALDVLSRRDGTSVAPATFFLPLKRKAVPAAAVCPSVVMGTGRALCSRGRVVGTEHVAGRWVPACPVESPVPPGPCWTVRRRPCRPHCSSWRASAGRSGPCRAGWRRSGCSTCRGRARAPRPWR